MRHLLGKAGETLDEGSVAEQLTAQGVRNVVLKLGARGVLLKEQNRPSIMVPGFPVNPVDTTAAGDAFNGAFAVGLVRGESALRSAQFANAVAAISVTRPGAQPSMPNSTEVEAFLQNQSAKTPRPATEENG